LICISQKTITIAKNHLAEKPNHFLPSPQDKNSNSVNLGFRFYFDRSVQVSTTKASNTQRHSVQSAVPEDQKTAGTTVMSDNTSGGTFIELTASIVSAYVSNNSVPSADLPALIGQVHSALTRVSSGHGEVPTEPPKPAISVKKSITPDHIVCLEDGKKFKSLKRHLRTQYNMTPEQYREKWGLASDYPMVAPNYAAARSHLAKQMGLGQQRRRRK